MNLEQFKVFLAECDQDFLRVLREVRDNLTKRPINSVNVLSLLMIPITLLVWGFVRIIAAYGICRWHFNVWKVKHGLR